MARRARERGLSVIDGVELIEAQAVRQNALFELACHGVEETPCSRQ
jgi:shikimate 5-dehydrogenase